MTFVRVARDQRGYETTYLLHAARTGERPRVLYCYRTAPEVRVGRPAFDEVVIREIEEQHPDVVFDWSQLIAEAKAAPADIERRPERKRRAPKLQEPVSHATVIRSNTIENADPDGAGDDDQVIEVSQAPLETTDAHLDRHEPNPLLDDLVGREIAAKLRTRYVDLSERLAALASAERRGQLSARVTALDPDGWSTADAVLEGVQHAAVRYEQLKRELEGG